MRSSIRILTIAVAVAAGVGCSFDENGVGPGGDGGGDDDSDAAIDASPNVRDDAAVDAGGMMPDACVPAPGGELCNGIDDDCDELADEDFALGSPCDGDDSDACVEGVTTCAIDGLGTVCTDLTMGSVESCNSMDDDCNGTIDDGFNVGSGCDGGDTDLCVEGVITCDGAGGTLCTDATDGTIELCNGMDDDCNGAIDDGFNVGMPCDGADSDVCIEGTIVCDALGGAVCNDVTAGTVETCNALDDDCDGAADEDFDLTTDVTNCGDCGFVCSNGFGTTACSGGMCTPTCGVGAQDCDSNPINGCELRNTNPTCPSATSGSINGDSASPALAFSGFAEATYKVHIAETNFGNTPLTARIDLTNPTGMNFDLFVYCQSCAAATVRSSTNGAGMTDSVYIGRDDIVAVDASYDILIEIRYVAASMCGNWGLSVNGNVATADRTCN